MSTNPDMMKKMTTAMGALRISPSGLSSRVVKVSWVMMFFMCRRNAMCPMSTMRAAMPRRPSSWGYLCGWA